MPQLAAERRLGDRNPELFEEPLRQIDQPPADDAMQGGNRPIFHNLPQGLALALAEDAGSARRFASPRSSGPLALKRTTQSRTICTPTPPIRAASGREPPS